MTVEADDRSRTRRSSLQKTFVTARTAVHTAGGATGTWDGCPSTESIATSGASRQLFDPRHWPATSRGDPPPRAGHFSRGHSSA